MIDLLLGFVLGFVAYRLGRNAGFDAAMRRKKTMQRGLAKFKPIRLEFEKRRKIRRDKFEENSVTFY